MSDPDFMERYRSRALKLRLFFISFFIILIVVYRCTR